MALCRCLGKHSPPKGRKNEYVGYAKPVGYPNSALVCGICDCVGVIWMTKPEVDLYRMGERIFDGPNNFARMKADNSGIRTSTN
jgi:hypothetical protein